MWFALPYGSCGNRPDAHLCGSAGAGPGATAYFGRAGGNELRRPQLHAAGRRCSDRSVAADQERAGEIELYVLRYARTFGLAGHTASLGLVGRTRAGTSAATCWTTRGRCIARGWATYGCVLRELIGNPAMTPGAAKAHARDDRRGKSQRGYADRAVCALAAVDVGTNRWAFKPEVGFRIRAATGSSKRRRARGSIPTTTIFSAVSTAARTRCIAGTDMGYDFRPGLWLAVDAASDGRQNHRGRGPQRRQAGQLTLRCDPLRSVQQELVGEGCMVEKGFTVRAGGDYEIISVALRCRWFDR